MGILSMSLLNSSVDTLLHASEMPGNASHYLLNNLFIHRSLIPVFLISSLTAFCSSLFSQCNEKPIRNTRNEDTPTSFIIALFVISSV